MVNMPELPFFVQLEDAIRRHKPKEQAMNDMEAHYIREQESADPQQTHDDVEYQKSKRDEIELKLEKYSPEVIFDWLLARKGWKHLTNAEGRSCHEFLYDPEGEKTFDDTDVLDLKHPTHVVQRVRYKEQAAFMDVAQDVFDFVDNGGAT